MYPCEVQNVAALLQQVGVHYVGRGYFFYVQGCIPEHKNPGKTDEKIVRQYGLDVSKWNNYRKRQRGEASVQYVRFRHHFLILATWGEHSFFAQEKNLIRDVRRVPIKIAGYSIGYRTTRFGPRVTVRLEEWHFQTLKDLFLEQAKIENATTLETQLQSFQFVFYAPVCRQVSQIIRAVNQQRKIAGLDLVDPARIFQPRRSQKIFKITE